MIKQAIISGVVCSSILLAGCNGSESEEQVLAVGNDQKIAASEQSKILSELQDEIITSISEQTAIEEDVISIMLGSGAGSFDVSVGFPKKLKVDKKLIEQIIEDSIKKVAESENVTISEEIINIKIEKY
ncbi:topoisomerase [Sporosarcina cyprini]|uniref:topoisomerase n=1 Tax=Sporosarcina cyprini TaxID=2910523 RepID=UPI001EDFC38B|nr:topoisomerase [Sporosarcina cyprini]MCG3088529.1 topoisomerase [Sporosarcina cyprini]